ncbi:capsid assembly protein [Indioceanicola profundi]|uniref:capsid assembly protein n=1 Tax=Indioceanicola profundi TaxID=2220096 RepID=UPI000E6AD730|nr:hypothetical protein [Indioceanicola profundi]
MTETTIATRPANVPEKFWDAEAGAIRVEALLKSYAELEKRLSAAPAPTPEPDRPALLKALGVPEGPEGYCIACDHGLFAPDPEVNGRLHAAGFTPEQAQLLYDLAAERMLPLVQELGGDLAADRELERLVAHFGGTDAWREVSRQILAWAERNLPKDAVEAMAATADGVLALHRMMAGTEPAALKPGTVGAEDAELHRMVRDTRYWRDRDPAFVAKVTEGFRRAYGG